jgi:hypothetical protein
MMATYANRDVTDAVLHNLAWPRPLLGRRVRGLHVPRQGWLGQVMANWLQ